MGETMPCYRPILSLIELSLRCNLRCLHCGSTAGKKRHGELSMDELRGVVGDLAGLGCQELVLLGGEPLLHEGWEELCTLATGRGVKPIIVTNGLQLTAEVARRLGCAGVHRVGVSIDGAAQATHDRIRGRRGSHARAWQAIGHLNEAGVTVTVITTITKTNVAELRAMRDQLVGKNLGWQIQTATPNGGRFSQDHVLSRQEFYEVGRFIAACRESYSLTELPVAGSHDIGYCSNELKNYAQTPTWLGCQGGISTVGIQSDGVIKPCLSLPEAFGQGNVRDPGGIEKIWKSPRRFVRNRRFDPRWLKGFCGECRHGGDCRAGCPDVAHNLSGSQFDNPHCLYRIEQEGE